MSPSQPAGGAVDESIAEPATTASDSPPSSDPSANGNGNGHRNGGDLAVSPGPRPSSSRPSRAKRTVLSPEITDIAGSAARGTSSQRGTSSTRIAKGNGDEPDGATAIPVPPPGAGLPSAPVVAPAPVPPVPMPAPPPPAPVVRPPARRLDTADLGFLGPPGSTDGQAGPPRTTITDHVVAPVPRVLGRRPRVRKVTRVVRHVDPWSVFKVALVFNMVLYGVALTAGVLLWNVAYATGTVDNLERFFESFGWSDFEFDGGEIFHNAWIAGLFAVVGLTGAAVLAATLFNLITDLVGGIRMTVLEEEVVEKTALPMRRFVVQRPVPNPDDTVAPQPPGPPTTLPARRDG